MNILANQSRAIFLEAIELQSPVQRAEFVAIACAEKPELRAQVERLLRSRELLGSFQGDVPAPTVAFDQLCLEKVGTHIGPYKLLEQIGEGGMGVVYVAQQNKPIQRRVALKIIKPGMDSRQVIARFEAERQTLAIMDHPNIAKVLDAGTTEAGLPYFVMELVKGSPITEFCDSKKLDTRHRLELFSALCHAVQHAHQKGIIHRDIKPSNVLVEVHDVVPVPKVIDFGVAKAMGQQLSSKTLYTGFSQMVGTPLYMSPEQAGQSSIDIDTRSDVYSLGVLLYELLTGGTPFDSDTLRKGGLDEMRRMIREVEPPRPSKRVSTLDAEALSTVSDRRQAESKKLSQQLRGELDWIVMKALEKDRNRRYDSANALADDVQRYLNDEEVLACPQSLSYRTQKFAHRYRVTLATTASILFILLAATTVSIRYAYFADSARRDSDKERSKTNDQRLRAEEALISAEQQFQLAESRRKKAEQLESEAIQQSDVTRRNLYIADIRLAAVDLRTLNIARLHKKLREQIPTDGGKDYRGWEWYFLQASGHDESKTLLARDNKYVDWSSDGTKISSLGSSDTAHIWNPSDGTLIRSLKLAARWNDGGIWSPNSQRLAWGVHGDTQGSRIWNSETDRITTLFWNSTNKNNLRVFSVAWSPNGRYIALGHSGGLVRIWDLVTNKELHLIDADCSQIWGIAWRPDGKSVATAGAYGNGGIRVWNATTAELEFEFGRGRDFKSVAYSNAGDLLIAGDTSGFCDIYDPISSQTLHHFLAHSANIEDIAVRPNANAFATSGADGVLNYWSLPDAEKISTHIGHEGPVCSISWSPKGGHLVSGSTDGTVKIWSVEVEGNATVRKFKSGEIGPNPITAKPLGPENQIDTASKLFLDMQSKENDMKLLRKVFIDQNSAPDDDEIRRYIDLSSQGHAPRPNSLSRVNASNGSTLLIAVVWSHDQSRFITVRPGTHQMSAGVVFDSWNARDKSKQRLWITRANPYDVSWAHDNLRVAIASLPFYKCGWTSIFEAGSGQEVHQLVYGPEAMTAVTWNHADTCIATGSATGTICLWDTKSGLKIASASCHQLQLNSLAFSPDDRRIASASMDGQVRIVDAETAEEFISINEGDSTVTRLAWSPNGRQLAGLNMEDEIVIWNSTHSYEYVDCVDRSLEKCELDFEKRAKAQRFMNDRKHDESLALLDEIISGENDIVSSLFLRANIRNRLKERDLEIADYLRVIEIDPKNGRAWNYKGCAEFDLGRFDAAIESKSNAIELDPDDPEIYSTYTNRGIIYEDQSRLELALADLQLAKTLNSKYQDAWTMVGIVQCRMGLLDEAVESLTTANGVSPQTGTGPRCWLAIAHIIDGQNKEGIRELESAFSDERTYESNVFLALAYLSNDDINLYKDHCVKLLSGLSDDSSNIQKNAAVWVCSLIPNALADYAPMIDYARRLAEKNRVDNEFRMNLASILFRSGMAQEAKLEIEKGLNAPPQPNLSTTPFYYFLALSEERLGNHEAALIRLEEAERRARDELALRPRWNRKLTNEILSTEARSIIRKELKLDTTYR